MPPHKTDFDNIDKNWRTLALISAVAGFWILRMHLWFLVEIKHPLSGKCYNHGNCCTVTRLDVIFRYPDRVPLTHFVHRAKQVFAMRAWIFCSVLCATGIFRWCNGKVIEHRVGANLRPSDHWPSVLPLCHCSLECEFQENSFSPFAGIFQPFL